MMELPPYRVPRLLNILHLAWHKAESFLKKAGTIIFILAIIIWGLLTFPAPPKNATSPAIHYSAAAMIGKTCAPLFRPIGFDWKITTALIPSFGARELFVSSISTVLSVNQDQNEEKLMENVSTALKTEYSLATLLSLLVWFLFSPQCIATFAILKKETNSYKMPLIFGAYTLALAYSFSFIIYSLFSL